MLVIVDCDIASTFAKINRIELLEKIFPGASFRITSSVYAELMRSKRAGFSFPAIIFSRFPLISLNDEELEIFKDFSQDKRIHYGEAEGLCICKNRGAVFLTNDSVVVKFCEEKGIKVLDLKDLLLIMAGKGILTRDEMKQLIEEIEKKDNTTIKAKDDILDVYERSSITE